MSTHEQFSPIGGSRENLIKNDPEAIQLDVYTDFSMITEDGYAKTGTMLQ